MFYNDFDEPLTKEEIQSIKFWKEREAQHRDRYKIKSYKEINDED